MKHNIEWYREAQKNIMSYALSTKRNAELLMRDYDRIIATYNFRAEQIDAAVKCGITEFDDERFLVKRKKAKV